MDPATGDERRVVQVMRRPFPGHYSIERVFEQLRPELRRQGYDVEAVTVSDFSQGFRPRLRAALEAARIHAPVVHVTGDITYAALLRRRRGTVLTVHDTEFLDRAGPAKRFVYKWLWLRLPVWRAEAVTVVSDATRADLEALVRTRPGKVRVVPNPVSAALVAAPEQPRPVPPEPVVLMIGTRPNKNVVRSLEALTGTGCRVVLVGDPNAEEAAAIDRSGLPVEVRTDVDDDGLRACYEDCDVLLFASTKEGFGIPVLEAQAMGRPVVTSDIAPLAGVAGPGGAALVDPHDPASIRAGVKRVLSDDAYRRALVDQGRINVAGYSPGAVAARYGAVYDEVARRR
ncbi:glycosyltransferase [Acidiferrimicrobium sp. IK]|uniref:glycosyltransferase n=1 Tax=Acidiferrimicrobium sp. IK TaxID=2871700 RepID=UPI0021CB2C0A|nr:glycosyltransferase [Acidiferrimicrobium sp. IK]MCU4185697.1 glycosyltransferase [Acidiferrimicrobium sp. IK]